ncbi:MAG: ribosomal L7Ae/L30e/S12e/Gadd45 family protein [Clostridia bacterium]|nr:ribosomal L7Ae/L30e/S12e/Gadd45 family protein [Clostridia bacterium]
MGFSIKSGKVVFGLDKLQEYFKPVKLVIVCSTVAENTYKKLKALCEYNKWKMVQLNEGIILGSVIGRDNCKVLAMTDKNLSKAVLDLTNIFQQSE